MSKAFKEILIPVLDIGFIVSLNQTDTEFLDSLNTVTDDYSDEKLVEFRFIKSNLRGLTMIDNDNNIIMIRLFDADKDNSVLVHELFHATIGIGEMIGAKMSDKSEEFFAYYMAYLYSTVMEIKQGESV